jgi:hypothetical protein
MDTKEPRLRGNIGVRGVASVVIVGFISLCSVPALLPGQAPPAWAQTSPGQETLDSNESQPLTAGQEEARQLARALGHSRELSAETAETAQSGIAVEQPQVPRRPVVSLFITQGVEGRLVGGQYTLASPVAEISEAAADANRPMFVPATQAAVGAEVLFE